MKLAGSGIMLNIVLTANSPGEVAAWVKPVTIELKKNYSSSL